MAGMGKRMRPHTLTVPKPLIPIAGKPIVQRLVEGIAQIAKEPIEEIAFIVGEFSDEMVESKLIRIAEEAGAKGVIYHQDKALGTAHAVYCAEPSLDGKVIIAFADTLFRADFVMDTDAEGIIWVSEVSDPSAFGVVKVNDKGIVTDFIEKPKTFVSNLAIIGVYFFRDGQNLKNELKWLIDNRVIVNGEFQLTDALENMKRKKLEFQTRTVNEWLDCGNKNSTVFTNQRILANLTNEQLVHPTLSKTNSVIVPPCFIGKNVEISGSVIGPFVSLGDNCKVTNSLIQNSIIQNDTEIIDLNLRNSMIGNNVDYKGEFVEVSIGDYGSIWK
jgi:glucose-1-phosphate thymidylyltransferase